MNNIFIIVNTLRYTYHSYLLSILTNNLFSDEFNVNTIDICNANLVTLGQQLSASEPDIIITLDLSGFEIRTFTDECFLNMLPCKICNIIWGNKPEYNNYLNGKLSLSMLFYDATGYDNQLPAIYPYIRYYYPTLTTISTAQIGIPETESQVVESLQDIWSHFTKEVLL